MIRQSKYLALEDAEERKSSAKMNGAWLLHPPRLLMLHVHVLLVTLLGAGHMVTLDRDQHEGGVAGRKAAHYTSAGNITSDLAGRSCGTAGEKRIHEYTALLKDNSSRVTVGRSANTTVSSLAGLMSLNWLLERVGLRKGWRVKIVVWGELSFINMSYRQVILHNGISFPVTVPTMPSPEIT